MKDLKLRKYEKRLMLFWWRPGCLKSQLPNHLLYFRGSFFIGSPPVAGHEARGEVWRSCWCDDHNHDSRGQGRHGYIHIWVVRTSLMLQPNRSFQWFLVYIVFFDFDLDPRALNWRWSHSWCACSSGRVFNYVKQHFEVPQEKSCLRILQETFPAGSRWIAPQGA